MKALILYFSGTGNTKYMAKKLGEALKEQNCEAVQRSIEEAAEIEPDSFDFLALGCPKYYEYPALNFVDYVHKNLPASGKTIPAIMFCTQTGPMETDFRPMSRLLAKKNYHLIAEKSIPIANNLLLMKAFGGTDPEKKKTNLEKADSDIKVLASCLIHGDEQHETVGRALASLERLVAGACTKWFPILQVKFSPSDECVSCGLCAKKCPRHNIKMSNGKPVFGKDCVFCTRCVNICPANAILYHKEKHPQYEMIEKI